MADVSVRGFAIIVLSVLTVVRPEGWFSALMTAILFAVVGWTVIVIASEIDALRSEIWKLQHEIRALRKELGTVE